MPGRISTVMPNACGITNMSEKIIAASKGNLRIGWRVTSQANSGVLQMVKKSCFALTSRNSVFEAEDTSFHRGIIKWNPEVGLVTLLDTYTMPADFDTFRSILAYCLPILVFPISTFFLSKLIIFDGLLQLDNISSNVYSAISAIVMLHINFGMFIYKAYIMDDTPRKPEKLD